MDVAGKRPVPGGLAAPSPPPTKASIRVDGGSVPVAYDAGAADAPGDAGVPDGGIDASIPPLAPLQVALGGFHFAYSLDQGVVKGWGSNENCELLAEPAS